MTRPILACREAREPAIERAGLAAGRLPCDVLGRRCQAAAALLWVHGAKDCMLEQPACTEAACTPAWSGSMQRRALGVLPMGAPASALGRKRARQAAGALSRERAALSPGPARHGGPACQFLLAAGGRGSQTRLLCAKVGLFTCWSSSGPSLLPHSTGGSAASASRALGVIERLLTRPSWPWHSLCTPLSNVHLCRRRRRIWSSAARPPTWPRACCRLFPFVLHQSCGCACQYYQRRTCARGPFCSRCGCWLGPSALWCCRLRCGVERRLG